MRHKQLSNSNISVPPIGIGTMGIGGYFSRDDSNDDHFENMLNYALAVGMTFIDTAEAYGAGHAEELVGKAVKGKRHSVCIATKVSPENLRFNDVIKAAEQSLIRLQTDYIDLYQIHWPNPLIPIGETLEAMERLMESGKIRHIGVSNFSLQELREALACFKHIESIQMEYNLFDRTIEEDILPFCEQQGISLLAYTPLCSGKITYSCSKLPLLQNIAIKYGKHPSQIALRWITTNNNVIAIAKASSKEHIRLNSSAVDFDLSIEDYHSIASAFKEPLRYIQTEKIKVDRKGLDKFIPSAEDLAVLIQHGIPVKPIRVVKSSDPLYEYELVEGKLRYWAWVIAKSSDTPIRALIRES